jgi:diaminopimelate epimerase
LRFCPRSLISPLRAFRAHGIGNDYLVVDAPMNPVLVQALCDRHRGLGSDGLLQPIQAPTGCDYAVRIYNPDGSEAEKSGNGLRIFATYLRLKCGAPSQFTVWTAGGKVSCVVDDRSWPPQVQVEMGQARVGEPRSFEDIFVTPVSVGNPHAVVWGSYPDWQARGARIEVSVEGRTNVQFAEIVNQHTIRAKIWERGAGPTLSSGSSSCAIAAAGVAQGRVQSPVTIQMEGGELFVEVSPDMQLRMSGPVEPVGEFLVEEAWLHSRC